MYSQNKMHSEWVRIFQNFSLYTKLLQKIGLRGHPKNIKYHPEGGVIDIPWWQHGIAWASLVFVLS